MEHAHVKGFKLIKEDFDQLNQSGGGLDVNQTLRFLNLKQEGIKVLTNFNF